MARMRAFCWLVCLNDSSKLPTYLTHGYLPACLPPAYLPAVMPPSYLPACLPPRLPACLPPTCLPTYLPPAYLPDACLLIVCPLACLLTICLLPTCQDAYNSKRIDNISLQYSTFIERIVKRSSPV